VLFLSEVQTVKVCARRAHSLKSEVRNQKPKIKRGSPQITQIDADDNIENFICVYLRDLRAIWNGNRCFNGV